MKDIGQKKESFNQAVFRINLKNADLRTGPKDRRKVHTYIANDRRSGIGDRREIKVNFDNVI